ncbi:MAG: amidohydrolase family protein, partial [Butyricicoccus sp.]
LGSVKKPEDAAPMVEWAHKYGFKVQMHTGGTSIPGSSTVTAADVMATGPDVVSHLNGGPTAISLEEVDKIMDETEFALEIVQCGNPRVADYIARRATEKGQLGRLIYGNDSPSGSGIMPLGILRNMCMTASVSDVAPEVTVCMAAGNTARVYGLNTGIIAPGREADLILMDAPMGSVADDALGAIAAGDIPGISMVLINGEVKVKKSRNTPPAKRQATM